MGILSAMVAMPAQEELDNNISRTLPYKNVAIIAIATIVLMGLSIKG